MLKIKDSVNIIELKKFGFVRTFNNKDFLKQFYCKLSQKDIEYQKRYFNYDIINYDAKLNVLIINNKISCLIDIYIDDNIDCSFESIDTEYYIQNLIQAGLVEKI